MEFLAMGGYGLFGIILDLDAEAFFEEGHRRDDPLRIEEGARQEVLVVIDRTLAAVLSEAEFLDQETLDDFRVRHSRLRSTACQD